MILETYLLEIQSTTKLYHLSQSDLDGKIIKPSVPSNIFTKLGLEDSKIPRISFASTISQCITAIGNNRIEGNSEKKYYVFEPDDYNKIKIISNDELIRRKLIVDAKQSGEIWAVSNVKFKEVGVIEIIKKLNLVYQIKDEPHEPFKFYKWSYKVLDGDLK